MLTKKIPIVKFFSSLILISVLFYIWELKNFGNFYSSEIEVSLDGNLFLNLLIIAICTLWVIVINKSEIKISRLANSFKHITSTLALSVALVVLFNVFVSPEKIYNLTGIFEFEWIIALELAIPFLVIILSSYVFSTIRKKRFTLTIIKYECIAAYILIFGSILMIPAGFLTYHQSETCNTYVHEFSNDSNFYKYQNLYDEDDGYKLVERIDQKTLVVRSIRSSVSEVKRFDTKAECRAFIQDKIINELGLPYLTDSVPKFDEKTFTIEYRGKVKKHIILETKERNLKITLPIAAIITCLIFLFRTIYGSKNNKPISEDV